MFPIFMQDPLSLDPALGLKLSAVVHLLLICYFLELNMQNSLDKLQKNVVKCNYKVIQYRYSIFSTFN